MSYFLFGAFEFVREDHLLQQIKSFALERDVYFWFNEEIDFYQDIHVMLEEQGVKGNIKFAITSKNQLRNSSDVIFPFDKYSNDLLNSNESAEFYSYCCKRNLEILFDCLNELFVLLKLNWAEIIVVEGFDDTFRKMELTIEEMKHDLLSQIKSTGVIDSSIYKVHR